MNVERTLARIEDQLDNTITKEALKLELVATENRLLKWMLGSMGVWSLTIIGALSGS